MRLFETPKAAPASFFPAGPKALVTPKTGTESSRTVTLGHQSSSPGKFGPLGCLILLIVICSSCSGGGGSGCTGSNCNSNAVLQSVTVTSATSTLPAGSTQQYTANAGYSDGTNKDVTSSATWASSDTTIVTVSSSGLATAVKQGSATITASFDAVNGSRGLTVGAPALSAITLSPAGVALVPGATQQLSATGTYTDKSTQDLTKSVAWTSSAPSIATIDSTGLVTSLASGSGTLTATLGSVVGSTSITVATPSVTLYGNQTDVGLLSADTPNSSLDVYGPKDQTTGLVQTVSQMNYTDTPTGTKTQFKFDANGRPVLITASNGARFDFNWESDTVFVITGHTADDSGQLSATVDLNNPPVMQPASKGVRVAAFQIPRRAPRLDLHHSLGKPDSTIPSSPGPVGLRPHDSRITSALRSRKQAGVHVAAPSNVSVVDVDVCLQPEDGADAVVSVQPAIGPLSSFDVPATPVGNGEYWAQLPSADLQAGLNIPAKCEAAKNALGVACDYIDAIPAQEKLEALVFGCTGLSVAAVLFPATAAFAPAILDLCTTVSATAVAACETVGQGPPVPGAPGVSDFLCDQVTEIDRGFSAGDVTLTARATVDNATLAASEGPQSAAAGGPYPSFHVQYDLACSVDLYQGSLDGTVDGKNTVSPFSPSEPCAQETDTLSSQNGPANQAAIFIYHTQLGDRMNGVVNLYQGRWNDPPPGPYTCEMLSDEYTFKSKVTSGAANAFMIVNPALQPPLGDPTASGILSISINQGNLFGNWSLADGPVDQPTDTATGTVNVVKQF